MRKLMVFLLFALLLPTRLLSQEKPTVLIVYYSRDGHTEALAEAVAEGARSLPEVQVELMQVGKATSEDVVSADAIVIGSPVYNANIAPPILEFINSWPFENAPLRDKIGAAFVTAGGISAGEELVQISILQTMLIFGMIVVGGPEWTQAFGASGIVEEPPFDKAETTELVAQRFLAKGEALGKRVAEWTLKLHRAGSR